MTTMAPDRAWQARLGELRFRVFTGTPVVEVAPAQWGLDASVVRQAAVSRRYRETPPGQAGFLRFEFAPAFFPRHFDRGPGTDADRRRLVRLLTGQPSSGPVLGGCGSAAPTSARSRQRPA